MGYTDTGKAKSLVGFVPVKWSDTSQPFSTSPPHNAGTEYEGPLDSSPIAGTTWTTLNIIGHPIPKGNYQQLFRYSKIVHSPLLNGVPYLGDDQFPNQISLGQLAKTVTAF